MNLSTSGKSHDLVELARDLGAPHAQYRAVAPDDAHDFTGGHIERKIFQRSNITRGFHVSGRF